MKKSLLFFMILMSFSLISIAQAPDYSEAVGEKMSPFTSWLGKWVGVGTMQTQQGPSSTTVEEIIEMKLGGTAILINGLGKVNANTENERVVHNALGILSYNIQEQRYTFHSWLGTGVSSEAWFEIVDTNRYQWGLDTPQQKIRYTITLDASKGTPGVKWENFHAMDLHGSHSLK